MGGRVVSQSIRDGKDGWEGAARGARQGLVDGVTSAVTDKITGEAVSLVGGGDYGNRMTTTRVGRNSTRVAQYTNSGELLWGRTTSTSAAEKMARQKVIRQTRKSGTKLVSKLITRK